MPRQGPPEPEVYRITGVQKAHSDDLDQRMGRYLISMLIRTVCFILVLVIPGPARWVFAVGAVILPYVAVVMANAGQARHEPALPTIVTRSQAGELAGPADTAADPAWTAAGTAAETAAGTAAATAEEPVREATATDQMRDPQRRESPL